MVRAWTLQDRILAPRTLHYGLAQMFWECKECLLAEDGPRFTSKKSIEVFPTVDSLLRCQQIGYSYHGLPPRGTYEYWIENLYPNYGNYGHWDNGWLRLVEDYSRRKLTRAEDKLPALAVLARVLAQQTGDTYLAGVWGNHLPEDLFWRVCARVESTNFAPGKEIEVHYGATLSGISQLKTYRAPSRSWASIDAGVYFRQMNFDHIVGECLEVHIQPSRNNPFGRVKGGYIKINVRVSKLIYRPPTNHFIRSPHPAEQDESIQKTT
jgi:hypothetical protein